MNYDAFLTHLPIALKGYAGVFLITGIIILSVYLLNRFSSQNR